MDAAQSAIVTGANGFIGSHLVRILLQRGWTVHALGRSSKGDAWHDRVLRSFAEAGWAAPPADLAKLHCHEADLARPDLGFPDALPFRPATPTVLVHLAGDTRFVPPDPAAQRATNVGGTLNVVRALRPVIAQMLHVSTAYVSGDRTGLVRETEADLGQGFHNNYEKTKLEAEVAVQALCREHGLPLTIARPSIIVNDTVTGSSSAFTHLNVLVEVANRIQEYYGIGDGEVVNREIRVPVNPAARPNTAPVDPIAAALALIMESPAAAGKTLHLCHPAPQANTDVFDMVMAAFGINGKINLSYVSQLPPPLTRTEEMIARAFHVYIPYLNHSATFDLANTRAIIPDYDRMFPAVTVDYLHKVIAFERATRKRDASANPRPT
jgi:nucleoside-diphosphate-sugar epimerase